MADRGKTFSAPMVRAMLEDRKTQTRRLLNPQPSDYQCASNPPAIGNVKKHAKPYFDRYHKGPFWCWWDEYDRQGPDWIRVPDAPGDRLYVREHWKTHIAYEDLAPSEMGGEETILYLADMSLSEPHPDMPERCAGRHRQAMHMPRWASRLTLLVTDVRVQRLRDISEDDAKAEGAEAVDLQHSPFLSNAHRIDLAGVKSHAVGFALLWNSLHAAPGTRWEDNPWIYATTFTVKHGNIDQLGEQ